ncbi:Riboflavin synthase eubacterial/eukaryotic [Enhygromyxa salina]|uniref:Riboflavin synthase n=1 Tax=Enhygromyxa salina TaxID=215803 RepID=A0A0C2D4U0_9BACT|nr:riboflavin synthase [Enhygromyxa salina]KIG18191.1 Riboflavin synthase eubacterial/eukaryotic [Enhygromyxa salina]
MFTGLVQTTGCVRELGHSPQSRRVVIATQLAPADRVIGASVCVSGVCLTVTESSEGQFAADVAFETLAVTTLGALEPGSVVNLEPSLRLGDALGGHLVSGHVDGVGHLRSVEARGDARECWFWAPEPLRRYIAVKGSIVVDGVSLTVNQVDEVGFMVGLIPHTLAVTTLGRSIEQHRDQPNQPDQPGHRVNLEVDMLARYVERLLQFSQSSNPSSEQVQP